MLISDNSSIILKQWFNLPIFTLHVYMYAINVYMCGCTYTWGYTWTWIHVCEGQMLTYGLFLYVFSIIITETGSLVSSPACSGNTLSLSLSLGDRIIDRVPHLAFMLVLGYELWFSCLYDKCFMYWSISLFHWTLSAVLLIISWQYLLGCFWLLCQRAFPSPVGVDGYGSATNLFQKLTTAWKVVPFWSLPRNSKP